MMAGDRNESEFPPSGCRWDGIRQQSHARLWSPERHEVEGNGSHGWEPPTDEQIMARMLERRAAKQALVLDDDPEDDFAQYLDDQLCVPCILCNCQGCDNCVPYGEWTYADGMAGDDRNGHVCDGEGC